MIAERERRNAGFASLRAVYAREVLAYATTPLAYVFIAVFLVLLGMFTFEVGRFFEAGRADLAGFFVFHPWLFMIFLPAIAMRLWSEDLRSGAIELLMTLPAPTWALVGGKFLAAWTIAALALALTAPLWITVNWLGDPDNAAIFTAYLASLLMAGAYVAIGEAASALTGTQVTAFVIGVAVSFLISVAGLPIVLEFVRAAAGPFVAEGLAQLSILHHFDAAQRGVIELRSIFYFLSLIALALGGACLAIDARRGG